jgi:hypothetical protein
MSTDNSVIDQLAQLINEGQTNPSLPALAF